MATYLATVKLTAQGVAAYKQTTKRAAKIRSGLKKLGAEVREIWWALGPFDGFLVFEAADDQAASAAALWIASQGNVTLCTSRIFNESEMAKVIASG